MEMTTQLTRMSVSRQIGIALDSLRNSGDLLDWRTVQELDGPRSFYVIEWLETKSPARVLRFRSPMMTTGDVIAWLESRGWVVEFGATAPRLVC